MHWTWRRVKQFGLVVTGVSVTVSLLLFTYTAQRKIKSAHTDIKHSAVDHGVQGALPTFDRTQNQMKQRSEDAFKAEQALIQQERLRQVELGCQAMSIANQLDPSLDDLSKEALTHYIVDDTNRLLYCSIPKAASTNWVRIFLALRGVLHNAEEGEQTFVQKHATTSLRLLSSYERHEMEAILGTYTKFVFVRNPLTRLLSAFRNKLDPKVSHEGHRAWTTWIARIKTHIRNSTAADLDLPIMKDDLTFAEFARFVVRYRRLSNKHWTTMVNRCRPCHINYTFIGKMETIETDARRVLQLAKLDKLVSFPGVQGSSPTNSSSHQIVASYFAQLSVGDIQRLRERYKWDFKLFGYDSFNTART